MFRVTIEDLETGEVSKQDWEHVEVTRNTGYKRVDPDDGGPQSPETNETGARISLLKCWSGESIGMQSYEDFVNFTDDTSGAPDTPDDGE